MKLVQVNIALMKFLPSDPRMMDLVGRIDEINRLADLAPGFIWRLPGDEITADSLDSLSWMFQPYEPARIFYNMSVWETVEDLKNFVYRTTHLPLLRDKDRWMDPAFSGPHLALWWTPTDTRPTIAESADRLRSLRDRGPTEFAFTFGSPRSSL